MVVATTFASNVARLKTLAQAGRDAGRQVVVLGRAMNTMLKTAHAAEVLDGFPPVARPARRRQRAAAATCWCSPPAARASAAPPRAQLAQGNYMGFELQRRRHLPLLVEDHSRQRGRVARMLNALSEKGVTVIDDSDGHYHVSGHANRPDLVTLQELVRPQMLVPMHGEHRHLSAHAALARERGMPRRVAPNGTMLDLTGDAPRIVEQIETGRVYLDGTVLIGAMDGVVRDRIRMAIRGHVAVSVIIDEAGRPLGGAWVEATGAAGQPEDARRARGGAGGRDRPGAGPGQAGASSTTTTRSTSWSSGPCARICNDAVGKKPVCTVMISRLEA